MNNTEKNEETKNNGIIVCFKKLKYVRNGTFNELFNNKKIKIERIHSITNAIKEFNAEHPNITISSDKDKREEFFENDIYPLLPDNEKLLYRCYLINGNDKFEEESIYNDLLKDPIVEFIQWNQLNIEYNYVPTDPLYNQQWNLPNINCPVAWDRSLGTDVIIAIVDSGVNYNHEDLAPNMWTDSNGYYGFDFSNNDNDPMDVSGHGTHCAGIAAAKGNTVGIIGVAPEAKIMAVKVFPNAFDSVCSQGIIYAVNNGAKIISNSWGPGSRRPSNPIIEAAIVYAHSRSCFVVFAAGNQNDDVQYYAPVNQPYVISVGATMQDNSRYPLSNYGKVTIAAPGGNILSTRYTGGYVNMSGTSMACPHIAGVIALMLKINDNLTFGNVVDYLQQYADTINTDRPIGKKVNAGNTMLNLRPDLRTIDVIINKLKIVDCADDDEDMRVELAILVRYFSGGESLVGWLGIPDVHVEEQGKIGNESKCVFFSGVLIQDIQEVSDVIIHVGLYTNDGDGYNWGGSAHIHTKSITGLKRGNNPFSENKRHSSLPNTQGEYLINYTISKFY